MHNALLPPRSPPPPQHRSTRDRSTRDRSTSPPPHTQHLSSPVSGKPAWAAKLDKLLLRLLLLSHNHTLLLVPPLTHTRLLQAEWAAELDELLRLLLLSHNHTLLLAPPHTHTRLLQAEWAAERDELLRQLSEAVRAGEGSARTAAGAECRAAAAER
eukprot:365302-Chlamydomonas_euryale.AAC.7